MKLILVVFVVLAAGWRAEALVWSSLKISRRLHMTGSASAPEEDSSADTAAAANDIMRAMDNARKNEARNSSPGAGLDDAWESADAAYADLINTSMDQRGLELSAEELQQLQKGGTMWEAGAVKTDDPNKGGVLGTFLGLLGAVGGGAHIEKNEFGET